MPQPDDRVLRMLGLAARAGAVVPGTGRVREAVRGGSVLLVVLAADASQNSRDKLLPLLDARGVNWISGYDRDTLGQAVGRPPLSAVGVTDARMAARVREIADS
jgi:ribosomal protein L7Ae-like RNA K-turn-binding protein